jgi:hypothetical protein
MKTWLVGFAGRLDQLPEKLQRSYPRRIALFAMSVIGPILIVIVVMTLWQRLFGLP